MLRSCAGRHKRTSSQVPCSMRKWTEHCVPAPNISHRSAHTATCSLIPLRANMRGPESPAAAGSALPSSARSGPGDKPRSSLALSRIQQSATEHVSSLKSLLGSPVEEKKKRRRKSSCGKNLREDHVPRHGTRSRPSNNHKMAGCFFVSTHMNAYGSQRCAAALNDHHHSN